jgi:signal transduction histidine kinase
MAVKEALNNAVKHAQAQSISLRITVHPDALRIIVSDDGRGFAPAAGSSGAGLDNLHRRLRACGGTLRIESQPGQGTAVVISLPLKEVL